MKARSAYTIYWTEKNLTEIAIFLYSSLRVEILNVY